MRNEMNKETVLASDKLTDDGRTMAKCLMKENGLSVERLFNLLGDLQKDVIELQRCMNQMYGDIDRAQFDIDYHINSHG
jgi:hypothetical protein